MGKEIKIGHDKRPAPLVTLERPLFNIRSGKPLTDEGGTPLVSQEDTFLTTEASSAKATSITFTDQKTFARSDRIELVGNEFTVTGDIITSTGEILSTQVGRGDILSLPTGNNGNEYEQRTVEFAEIISGNTRIKLIQPVSFNRNFTRLYKLRELRKSTVWRVEEQFPEFSEVSTSLLGYPKAETQLSLFANVSSYGLDGNEFLFYTASGTTNSPAVWENRKNRIYGNHYRTKLNQVKEESAIALEVFPVPYSYPFGPQFAPEGLYNQVLHQRFNNFMKLGAILYDYYSDPINNNGNQAYKNNFFPYVKNHYTLKEVSGNFQVGETITGSISGQSVATVIEWKQTERILHFNEEINLQINESLVGNVSGASAQVASLMAFATPESFFDNLINPLNPRYISTEAFMAQIDTWTETWRDMSRGLFNNPSGAPIIAEFINNLSIVQQIFGQEIFPNQTTPGYSTAFTSSIFLRSRKAFRYQPGRISGYTFGTRASGDASDSNTVIEWGIGNPTDDLKFQIRGGSFNIVRRSIVPLSIEVLFRNGLSESDQVNIGTEEEPKWEVIIPRDKWNGDTLDGNGPSRYDWKADRVTMYKIEFGWYGAIGVQFYAFIPVRNDEARWVKLHRLVIENSLNEPCMGDPFYYFDYSVIVRNNLNLRTPQFVYKYGTSCYIDGGDEGTVTVYSASSDLKQVSTSKETTLLAVNPKTNILSSLGKAIKNKKSIFPKQISLTSDGLTQIQVVKCKGCTGFGQAYTPNLRTGVNGISRLLSFVPTGANTFDRSQVEYPVLTKTVTNTNGTNELTLNNVTNLKEGDYIKPASNINGIPYFDDNTVIEIIDRQENTIIINKNLLNDFVTQTNIEIQPLFTKVDYGTKLIAPGIWNTYISDSEFDFSVGEGGSEVLGYTTARLQGWDYSTWQSSTGNISKSYKTVPEQAEIGGTIQNIPSQFTARMSTYSALAASQIPVSGRINKLRFLFTNSNDVHGQYAEWKIGVTYLKPEETIDGIQWRDKNGQITELTDATKLSIEMAPLGTGRSFRGFENGESFFGHIRPFTIDYRIPSPPGAYGGTCAEAEVQISPPQPISCEQILGVQIPAEEQEPDHDNNAYYIRVQGTFGFEFNPDGGEIGFNLNDQLTAPEVGSNIYFASEVKSYQTTIVDEGQSSIANFEYIKITDNLVEQQAATEEIIIWYVPIDFVAYRRKQSKALNYNPFPLFFFVEMRDNARMNNIIIEEQTQFKNTYNPTWLISNDMQLLTDNISVGVIGNTTTTTGSLTSPPPNYQEIERLSSAEIDVQNESELRPYEVIDTFYVANETKTVDLTNIFGFGKEVITPDLLNTEAVFFIATSKELDDTFVQATLTYTEQQ
jgi:hypothetical protein